MRLSDLLANCIAFTQLPDIWIADITSDSRKISNQSLFMAYPGLRTDGRQFIATAIANGAAAVLYENSDRYQLSADLAKTQVPLIGVPNLNEKLGIIASRFYQNPSEKVTVVGVTGTNGKTSVTQFIAQALTRQQRHCAVIGTLGKGFLPNLESTGYTTPDAIGLQKDLAECLSQGADSVAMEVSSHSLSQHRVAGIQFDVGVFTNLTQDHLDYHKTMEAYGAAKAQLFQFPSLQYAIYNADDPFGLELLSKNPQQVQALVYSTNSKPEHSAQCETPCIPQSTRRMTILKIIAEKIIPLTQGFNIKVSTPWGSGEINSKLIGRFNISNLLAVLAVLGALQIPFKQILKILEQLQPVTGRMQTFGGGQNKPLIVVDYAHTPDALLQALSALREHHPKKLWCVFGCGGDRDRGKRPKMGAIAAQYSDHIIITNDNPRSELPEQIAAEVKAGIPASASVQIELDRARAISLAIQQAGSGDIVLIAGKGHETEQIIGNQVLPFSDINLVQILTETAIDLPKS